MTSSKPNYPPLPHTITLGFRASTYKLGHKHSVNNICQFSFSVMHRMLTYGYLQSTAIHLVAATCRCSIGLVRALLHAFQWHIRHQPFSPALLNNSPTESAPVGAGGRKVVTPAKA